MLPLLLALACIAPSTTALPQTAGDALALAAAEVDPYPPVRPKTRVLAFLVDRESDAGAIAKALSALSTPDVRCRLAGGLGTSYTLTKSALASVETPIGVDAKDVLAALKKVTKRADRLACTTFNAPASTFMAGVESGRDRLVSSGGDPRWAISWGDSYQLYTAPDKARADGLAAKLAKILGTKTPPPVAEHSFDWSLAAAVDSEAAKRIEKAVNAIPGVMEARIDAAKNALAVKVELKGLDTLGPPIDLTAAQVRKATHLGVEVGETVTKACFDTTPIFDVLEREKVVLKPKAAAEK